MMSIISGFAAVPTPQWYLPFEGNYNDMSGNNHHGTTTGSVSIEYNSILSSNVLSLDGSSAANFVAVPYALSGSYTKAGWIYHRVIFPSACLICSYNGSNLFALSSNSAGGGPSFMSPRGGIFSPYTVWDPVSYSTGTWIHMSLTYDDTSKIMKLYTNGVLVGTGLQATGSQSESYTAIGSWAGTNAGLNGYIDNVAMWNTALSDTQINEIYHGNYGIASIQQVGGIPFDGGVKIQFTANNTGTIIDYHVYYKGSTATGWTLYNDGNSTDNFISISGLINGSSYDFYVVPVLTGGTEGNPSSRVRFVPGKKDFYYILSSGQSTSIGWTSSPSISLEQPYNNLMLAGGVDSVGNFLVPLVETSYDIPTGKWKETPSSGLANTLAGLSLSGTTTSFVTGLHGVAGTAYSGLKKGTTPYQLGMQQMQLSKSYIESAGNSFYPLAVTIGHGGTDYMNGVSVATYESYLQEWQHDYESDVNAIMGATGGNLPMYINQMNYQKTGEIANAQLSAHKNNAGKIILVGPKYQYVYNTDKVHHTATESKHIGEMYAKVIHKVGFLKQTWNPLMPTKVERLNNIVYVDFLSPTGDIVFDTGAVAERLNYGFEFYQSGGLATTITSVDIIPNTTRIKITLDQVPTGLDQRIRYAYTCYDASNNPGAHGAYGNCGDSRISTYVGGNLRDTDSSVSPSVDSTGLPLYDWAVTFDEAITPIVPPSEVLSLSGTVSNPLLTLNWITPTSSGGSDITDYSIEYKPTLDSTWLTYPHMVSTGTTLTLSGLTHNMSYDFRVSALNRAGTGTTSSTLTLTAKNDTIPPVLTLSGSSPYQIAQGSLYSEPGVIWSDNIDGSGVLMTSSTTASGTLSISGSVNSAQIGTYTLDYLYTDTSGNTGSIQRTVEVVDRDTPLLTLIGTSPLILAQTPTPTTYVDSGAIWTDNVDGTGETTPQVSTLSGSITVDGSGTLIYPLGGFILSGSVDTSLTGTYLITYIRIDQAGNRGSITRTITVTDQTPPTVAAPIYTYTQSGVALSGTTIPTYPTNRPVMVTLGTPSELISITNNNLTSTGAPNTDPRSYTFTQNGTFTFLYQDMAGNTGSTTVTVSNIDTVSPSVTLNSQNPMVVLEGATWSDPGATWSDNIDGTGTLSTASTGTVVTNTPGNYALTYTYTDRAGNTSTLNRIVIVQPVSHAGGGGGGTYTPVAYVDRGTTLSITPDIRPITSDSVSPKVPNTIISDQTVSTRILQDFLGITQKIPKEREPIHTTPTQIQAVDIDTKKIAHIPLITLIQYGVIADQKQVQPDRSITRAEFIKVLSRMNGYTGSEAPSIAVDTLRFRDTDPSKEITRYIAWGVQKGWINTQNTQFRPNDPISYGEAMKLISVIEKRATATTRAVSSTSISRARAAEILLSRLGVQKK